RLVDDDQVPRSSIPGRVRHAAAEVRVAGDLSLVFRARAISLAGRGKSVDAHPRVDQVRAARRRLGVGRPSGVRGHRDDRRPDVRHADLHSHRAHVHGHRLISRMPSLAISSERLSKLYRLGVIGTGTLHDDFERWWARVRGLPDPTLKVDAVHRPGHGAMWALKDISFDLPEGATLGIIGSNGAGKSTLLKVLSRITAPTEGCVRLRGRVASLLEVGTGFHPELTGRENVYLNGTILGMRKTEIDRKFDEIVAFAEIEKFLDTPVKRYSSGMYMRLAFAVASHLEPEILIVDEVLAVGDAAFQKKCLGKMGEVAKEGRTVIFVSHNMTAIRSLCQRAIWLDNGEILESGQTNRVILNYIQKGAFATLEKTWEDSVDAPGDETARLRYV